MAQFTLITRIADGLPFMESTESISPHLKDQAKSISKRLDAHSATRLRVDCGGQQITYLMEEGLCFLVVTDTSYPQRLTLSFLISLHKEFTQYMRDHDGEGWRTQLGTCATAYAYQGFTSGKLVQLKKDYADPSSKSNASRIADELQDVHSIMRKNIQEVLQRGENLDRALGGGCGAAPQPLAPSLSLCLLIAPLPSPSLITPPRPLASPIGPRPVKGLQQARV